MNEERSNRCLQEARVLASRPQPWPPRARILQPGSVRALVAEVEADPDALFWDRQAVEPCCTGSKPFRRCSTGANPPFARWFF